MAIEKTPTLQGKEIEKDALGVKSPNPLDLSALDIQKVINNIVENNKNYMASVAKIQETSNGSAEFYKFSSELARKVDDQNYLKHFGNQVLQVRNREISSGNSARSDVAKSNDLTSLAVIGLLGGVGIGLYLRYGR